MKNVLFLEEKSLKQVMAPVDLNAAAITGARIGLKKGDKVAVILSMGTSTAATVSLSLKQHNAASGGSSKALSVANPYFHKAGAADVFTKVEPSVATDAYDVSAIFAADGGVLVLEVLSEQLDVDGGFTHFSVDIADSGAAKIAAGVYVLNDMRVKPAYSEAI
jgi:hypothetical protein